MKQDKYFEMGGVETLRTEQAVALVTRAKTIVWARAPTSAFRRSGYSPPLVPSDDDDRRAMLVLWSTYFLKNH
jgi:hypothetical protein